MSGRRPARELQLLLVADVGLVLLYLLDRWIGPASDFLTHFLDLNGEANLPSWASTLQLAATGVLLLLAARRRGTGGAEFRGLLALGLLFLGLSLDEAASIHEWLGHLADRLLPGGTRAGTVVSRTGIWMLVLVPLAAAWIGWHARSLWRGALARPEVRWPAVAGILLLFGSAGGVELLSNLVQRGGVADALLIATEEGGELAGASLLLVAALALGRSEPAAASPTSAQDK